MRPGFDLQGKRVLVVGLARTGVAASLFSAGYGAMVTATDEKPEAEMAETAARLRAAGVKLELGAHTPARFLAQDLIVVSPGVPAKLPALELARAQGIPVWSEIELAWRFLRGKLVAITGSNGKTTTTSLVAHILKTAGIATLVGGNIGVPLLALVESSTDSSVTVAEISSFQLETIQEFRPEIGVLLNLTPDHLDRHESFEAYAAAKMRLFENQLERDAAVLNADDPEITKRMPSRAHVYWFSRQKRVAEGAFLRDGEIVFRADGLETVVARRSEIALRGEHNLENVLAACAAAYLAGAPAAAIAGGVKTFRAVEHRLEFVAEVGGVEFYNDSKATNVDATLKAHRGVPRPADRDSRRQGQGQSLHAAGRAAAPARAPGDLDWRRRGKNRGGPGRCRPGGARGHSRSRRETRGRARAAGRRGVARAGVFELRPVRELRAARAGVQGTGCAPGKPFGGRRCRPERMTDAA